MQLVRLLDRAKLRGARRGDKRAAEGVPLAARKGGSVKDAMLACIGEAVNPATEAVLHKLNQVVHRKVVLLVELGRVKLAALLQRDIDLLGDRREVVGADKLAGDDAERGILAAEQLCLLLGHRIVDIKGRGEL